MGVATRVLACAAALSLVACGDAPTEPLVFPERDWDAKADELLTGPEWYRHAVFYEVFVRSLQDTNDDGIGDIAGLTSRLDDLQALGVDALWLMPIMPTPYFDSGYDVADYEAINPDYGSMDDFDALLDEAHARGMRVLIDLVLNHTSNEHAWFEASRSDPAGEHGDFYIWSDTKSHPDVGCGVHNSTFGDDPWAFDEARQQYYYHRFYPEQPDLNYRNPAVVEATLDVARFWLDRGVDGFRCDVVALLYESADACELLDETKAYVRELRAVVDEYPGAVLVAEPTNFDETAPYYGEGDDMFHMTFNFAFGYFWGFHFGSNNAARLEEAFEPSLLHPEGAQEALVIGSHDVARAHAVALGDDTLQRRAAIVQMTMPGTPFIYYGEEVGLRAGTAQVVDNRDAARTPLTWSSEAPGYGFTGGTPWLPFGAEPEATSVSSQQGEDGSTYAFYRQLLALRRGREVWGVGSAQFLETDNASVLVYLRDDGDLAYLVGVNLGDVDETARLLGASLPSSGQLLLGDGSLTRSGEDAELSVKGSSGVVFRLR